MSLPAEQIEAGGVYEGVNGKQRMVVSIKQRMDTLSKTQAHAPRPRHPDKGSCMKNLSQHPLSAAFPGMTEKELEDLIRDIESHGQRDPITLFEGMVLDGWHRYLACKELDILPDAQALPDDEDPVAFVQSKNLHRRHLTGSQRAAAITACAAWAKPGNQPKGEPSSPLTVPEMAKAADVSERTIQQAKRAQEAGLGEAVRDGKVTAREAAEIAKLPKEERQAAIEAPRAPKQAPAPKPETSEDVAALKARIVDLEEQNEELAQLMKDTMEENESMHRIMDAEDLLANFNNEVKRFMELARVTTARNNGLINEVNELKGFCKMWRGKFERIEKANKAMSLGGVG